MSWARISSATASAFDASTWAATSPVIPDGGDECLRPGRVVVGDDEFLEEVPADGDADGGRTDPAGADDEDAHVLDLLSQSIYVHLDRTSVDLRGVGHENGGVAVEALAAEERLRPGKANQMNMSTTPKARAPTPITNVPPIPEQDGIAVLDVVHVDRGLDECVGEHQRAEQREQALEEEVARRGEQHRGGSTRSRRNR